MFILAKIIGIGVLVWFSITGKQQGEYWLRWALVGLLGYWLTWFLVYATVSIPFLDTAAAFTAAFFIRQKLVHDAKKAREAEHASA